VRAGADGLWYFTVRALNAAHSWGPPARLAVRIDTRPPRLRVLSVPGGAVNPRRLHPLVRLLLTEWSRVTVDVVAPDGRVVRSLPTPVHAPSFRLGINWNGLATSGARVPNGRYRLRIIATNRGGVTWQTARPLYVEDVPPAFASYGFSQPGTYNPYNNGLDGPEVITATLDDAAKVRVEALHGDRVMRTWQLTEPRAGDVITATWDGSTVARSQAPSGLYTFRTVAVDAAGNRTTAHLGAVVLDHRRIVVSLDTQQLWALDGKRVLLTTLVTTGGPELPTPTGDFQVIDRESPFTFISPYPQGSPYWYAPSTANFVLLFQVNGYFIHDAPWRTFYGPGSNTVDGTPGTNTTGTHGCVNVPYQPMLWLYNWATMDTPVQVRQHFTPG
jgi:flagellar hook assembly protein FlgD